MSEEDIKILEDLRKELGLHTDGNKIKQGIALEHLIKAYKELEESNQEKVKMLTEQNRNLKISYDSLQELFELRKYKENSIPVSLVEETKKELNENYINSDNNVSNGGEFLKLEHQLEILEKLLEKRK